MRSLTSQPRPHLYAGCLTTPLDESMSGSVPWTSAGLDGTFLSAAVSRKFKVALIQLAVGTSKPTNLERVGSLVRKAASNGAKLITLPECFNSPYGVSYFPSYAEPIPGESSNLLSTLAKECQVYLVGGSIPERDEGKLYNTCCVFGPGGDMIGKYRKMHLADIDIPGRIRSMESEVLCPGNNFLTFDTDWCKVGIGICYDMRFPELASIYNQKGCELLIYPGAFNTVTGPIHLELLGRGRAVDSQCYVAFVIPARDEGASYVTWGHTSLVDPWGKVVAGTEEKEAIVYGEVDLDCVADVRRSIPTSKQKRLDLYSLPHPKT